MLELEVVPERSLGCDEWEFVLGMHISQAIAIIQSQVGIIKEVEVLYSDTDPLEVDVVINMTQDGIRLVFEPVVQRLKVIEISNMKLVKLKYCGNEFNSPEMVPSIEQIENSFGATHPGIYDAAKQLFALNFRGLSFYFPVDSKLEPDYAHGLGSLQFPNGSSPVVSKMAIYSGANITETHPPPLPVLCYDHHVYLESAKVLRNSIRTIGLHLEIYFEEKTDTFELQKRCLSRDIYFGDSCQDVATSLGAPDMIYYKGEDKMKIHSPGAHQQVQTNRSDYFFNYFTLGIDVLFDAITKRCKKIILHTNYPGHYNFNIYHRCEFRLELPADKVVEGEPLDSPVIITAFSKWDDISSRITPAERPVVLRRAGLTNSENPFGSTFCFGYHDIIFEVMQNGHIAAVTLYSLSSLPKLCSETVTNPKTSAKSKPSSSKEQTRPSGSFECKPSCSYEQRKPSSCSNEQPKPSSSYMQGKPSTTTDHSNEKRKLSSTNEQSNRSPSHERSKQTSNIEKIRPPENPECKLTLSNEQKKPSSSKEQLKLCSTDDRSKSPSSNEESTPSSNNEESKPSPSHGQSKRSSSNQRIKRINEESSLSSNNEQSKPSPSHEESKPSSNNERSKRVNEQSKTSSSNEENTPSSSNEQSKPSPCHEQSKLSSNNERSKRVNEQSKTSSSNEESTPSSSNEQSKPSPCHEQNKPSSNNEKSKRVNEQSKTSSSNEENTPSSSNEQSKTSSSNEQCRGSIDPEYKSGSSNQESKPEPSNEPRKSKSNKQQNKGSSNKQHNKGSSKQQSKSSRNQDSSSCT